MSTLIFKQVFASPDDYLRQRSMNGGPVNARKSLLDPSVQVPVFMSGIQASRPSFVLRDGGYVAIRGKQVMPEDEGKDKVEVV